MSLSFNKFMKATFVGKLLLPLQVVKEEKGTFFLWFLFTIIAGLIGPIINAVNRCAIGNETLVSSLEKDCENGTFYTFSIVLIASSIGLLFIKLINEKIQFKNRKLYFIAICIFPMFFAGIFYSGATLRQKQNMEINEGRISQKKIQQKQIATSSNTPTKSVGLKKSNENAKTDYQVAFVIIAIIIAIYSFCLEYMSLHPEKFDVLRDDYNATASERIGQLEQSSKQNPQKTQIDDILYEQS